MLKDLNAFSPRFIQRSFFMEDQTTSLGVDLFLEFQTVVEKKILSFILESIGCYSAILPVNLDSDTVPIASHSREHGRPASAEWIENGISPEREHAN